MLSTLLLSCNTSSNQPTAEEPRGSIFTGTGQPTILVLRGSHYQRGKQHGELCAEGVLDIFHNLLIDYLMGNDSAVYGSNRAFLQKHFDLGHEFIDEARGMVDGMKRAGVDIFDRTLQREIDMWDIVMISSMEELLNIDHSVRDRFLAYSEKMGCSSISSWGSATAGDALLKGELVITRHWDYPRFEPILRNLIIVVHHPSEIDEQPWVGICWAGMIGCCSAMNSSGVGAFLNYGPNNGSGNPVPSRHRQVSISLRRGIEKKDLNGDGFMGTTDVLRALSEYVPYFGSIVHAVSSVIKDSPAVVIELDNVRGLAVRTAENDSVFRGENLAATNHYRILYEPIFCSRYDAIIDSLIASSDVSLERSWILLAGAGAFPDCIYSLSFVPANNLLRISFASPGTSHTAYELQSTYLSLDSLMNEL